MPGTRYNNPFLFKLFTEKHCIIGLFHDSYHLNNRRRRRRTPRLLLPVNIFVPVVF